jgi:uncharacterized membrane protein HdeD (DUF308 family)
VEEVRMIGNKRFRKVEEFRPLYKSEREMLAWLLLGNSIIINGTWILMLLNIGRIFQPIFLWGISLVIGGIFNIIMLFAVNEREEWYEEMK